ncbi:MAG: bis(5'-nucleosyl)-tetraphosphatase [Candidatus Odinarchaeia archaeon]
MLTVEERSVGAVVFRKNKKIKFLILKYGWGHWGFPKGLIEPGEKEVDTAMREIREETGITDLTFITGFKETIEYYYSKENKRIHKKVTYLLAETNEKHVTLSFEHTDYGWLEYEDALNTLTYENDKKVLTKAYNFIKKVGVQKKLFE